MKELCPQVRAIVVHVEDRQSAPCATAEEVRPPP